MLNLKSKLISEKNEQCGPQNKISIRDKLLVAEIQEMEQYLPSMCSSHFPNPDVLHLFNITICPEEGFWKGGHFTFYIEVPEGYNFVPPKVTCKTGIWHPNISEDGQVCLSLLRESSLDGHGWAPTRKLKDLVWGLNSLFTDLLNFDDPLNVEAAEHYRRNPENFKMKVIEYIMRYAKS